MSKSTSAKNIGVFAALVKVSRKNMSFDSELQIPLPTVKLARSRFVFGFIPILLHIRRIAPILVCQIRRFPCWMSSDDLEKHSTVFSSRSACIQFENTHLVVENEIFKNLEIFEKILRKSILIKNLKSFSEFSQRIYISNGEVESRCNKGTKMEQK